MIKEILDQPRALTRSYEAERAHALEFKTFARRRNFRLILLVARGTSDNAALFGRYLLELTTGIPVSLCAPSIHTLYHAKLDLRDALVVGISQSGEATDVNVVLKAARRQRAFTVGITNEAKSSMAGLADEVFLVRAGTQRSVAATKTYTGQLLMLYLLAAALALASIFALRRNWRGAVALVWVANTWGFLDLLNGVRGVLQLNVPGFNLATLWYIYTFYAPLVLLSHLMIFAVLIKSRSWKK